LQDNHDKKIKTISLGKENYRSSKMITYGLLCDSM